MTAPPIVCSAVGFSQGGRNFRIRHPLPVHGKAQLFPAIDLGPGGHSSFLDNGFPVPFQDAGDLASAAKVHVRQYLNLLRFVCVCREAVIPADFCFRHVHEASSGLRR